MEWYNKVFLGDASMDTCKRLGLIIVVCGFTLHLLGCSKPADPFKDVPGGPTRVLVTIPPLYCFTKSVAGDDAAVLCLLTAQGPHDYEATTADVLKVRKASLFLTVGLGLDDFAHKIANASGNDKLKTVTLGGNKGLPRDMLLASEEDDDDDDKAGHKDKHGHHHGEFDPHVWLGIPQAIKMVEKIKITLQEADAKNTDYYEKRAAAYVGELDKLHQEGREALKGAKHKKIIAMHDSLRYFAKAFDLEIVGSIQPRAGTDVAEPAQMARLVKLCKEKGVRVIAVEPQFKTTSAETLKKQLASDGVMVELVEIDPLETVAAPEDLDAKYYVVKMKQNIMNLAKKLQ
jgi:zinc transport system substrate-binding protein